MLRKPPPGWATLQERARRAGNPTELAQIIDEMNKMLAEHEKATGDHNGKPNPVKQGDGKQQRTRRKT
jgi:hypothetical protein